jgi:Raf kinase inhibitor-like YbhB/YbcL family protein
MGVIAVRSGTVHGSRGLALVCMCASLILAGCRHRSGPPVERDGPDSLSLHSSSLQDGQFPAALTCDGSNTSPDLHWQAPPQGTQSFSLILNDPDAPESGFVHWILFNLPASARSLPASFSTQPDLPDGTRQGMNDFEKFGYSGPCPHGTHHYVFTLLALDAVLNLAPGATRAQLDEAMKGHVLARGVMVATYSR